MGVEAWEVKYKTWGKGSRNDFCDEERDLDVEKNKPNNIHHARSSENSMISQQPLKTKDKTSLNPAYPEGYNTIDRRLRKKVRDPVGLVNARMECIGENFFNPDLALLRQKRGELVLRQVAEMEEDEEKMMPCLRPYKNGLFYKTRMQAKNKPGGTLHDHMVDQDEEETRLGLSIDPNSEGSDEMQGSEEELEEFCSEISQHYKHKVSSFGGYTDQLQGYCDRKTPKGKIGRWTPEDMLSPVEEPSDEYVDPIDELQCLVETVSEYLAEKEEEINKYGSLPETSKSRLSSKGSARTESFGDEKEITSKELNEDKAVEVKEIIFSEQGSDQKNAKNSLFSSLTDRIVPSLKQTRSNSIQRSETSNYVKGSSGLSKLLSFMTKSTSPAPVAVVSPTQETPAEKRTFLMPTQPSEAKPQEIIQRTPPMSNTQMQNNSDLIKQEVNECQPPSSVSSGLKQVNPQKISEGGVNETSKSFSEKVCRNELNRNHRDSLDQSNDIQDFKPSREQTRTVSALVEGQIKSDNSETTVRSHKSTEDLGFFSPLKKTFSSLISPVPCIPSQHQTQTVFPVCRSGNVREAKSLFKHDEASKMEVPFLDSSNVPTQQPPKAERAMISGLLKFASGDNTGELKSSPKNTVKPAQTALSKSNHAAEVSLNPNKSSSPAQNHLETEPMMTLETSWFSSHKTAPNENVRTASPQSRRLVNQSSQPLTGSNQNRVRGEHQKPVKEVEEDCHNMQQTPKTSPFSTVEPNASQPETRGLFSTLFKSLSSDDTAGPKTGLHSVQGGLFSGIMKFASTGDVSEDTQSNPVHPRNEPSQISNPALTHLENQPTTHPQAHKTSPLGVPFVSSKEPPQHRDSTDQQPPQPEQASSQKGSILSGLFKLISSDSISDNQANSWQHENVPASIHPSHQPSKQNVQTHYSRISNDHPDRQKIIEEFSRKSDHASQPANEHGSFFSGLFKFSSGNLSAMQTASTQQSKPKNGRQSSLESKSTKQYPPLAQEDTQSEVLSGNLNKLRASSEEGAQSKWAPHNQKQQWQGVQNEDSQNVLSYKQQTPLHTLVRDQMPPDSGGQSVQCMDQSGCVTTSPSLISNILKKHSNESPSGADLEMDKETNGSAMFASCLYRCNGMVINNVPVYSDGNNLDPRTLASYERSQQMNATYISDSTGHLPDMSTFPDSSFLNHVNNLYSTDTPPISPVGLTGQVQTPQPYLTQSYPSLYSSPEPHACNNNLFYGLGPNYEHYWSQNSVLREQMNNHSMSYDPWKYSHAQSLEALLEWPRSLNMDENQQYYSAHDWMAFNSQKEYPNSTINNLNVQKMWSIHNSLDMLNNCGSCTEGEGVLNLSKKDNAKFGSWQSFNEESCYSLNTVVYPEGCCEEHPTNLSYPANRENTCTRTYEQPANSECDPGLIGCPNGWNYTSVDIEDYAYFEDTEWYQQWLLLLEQGMWWQADDGDCGYFVYTDHEYIYALLTDGSGQYVYACAPDEEVWGNGQISNYPSALLHNEMVIVCGFKIPLHNEDELFWFPGQDQSEAQLLNAPLDLSDAFRKGNEIMNLNLERFSQMFESSVPARRQQAIDFSLYRLNKVKMDTRQQTQNDFANQDSFLEVLDLRVNGPNCNLNRRTKELLSQKVCISVCPTPTPHSSGVYSCYQPHQRRRSSFGLQVKHIDDLSQEEWRKRVQPGEERSKKSIKKISPFSSLVGKSQESKSNRNINGSKTFTAVINASYPGMIQENSSIPEAQSGKEIKSIPSPGLQGIKSKTIKNDVSPLTPKESTDQQPSEIGSSRILSKIPSSVSAQGATRKPKLARQATVSQQSSISEVSIKSPDVSIKSVSSIDAQGGKKPEQNQGGFLSFFRNAIGIEEPSQESVKSSQAVKEQTEKNKNILDGIKDSSTDKGTGMTKLLGSVGELLNMESTTSQHPSKESCSQKSSARHQTFGSRNDAKEPDYVHHRTSESEGIQKPQRQSRFSLGSQSDIPKASQTPQEQMPKNVSQIFSLDVKLISGAPQTMPTIGCNKSEPSTKSTSGLFGFSIANSGRMNNKEETAGRGLLSMFNNSSSQQVPPQSESASQCQVRGESSENTIGNRILSFFGSSSTEKAALLNQTEKAPQKETSSVGLLSVFSATSTQQTSTRHTGSSNQASPNEASGIKVLHVFSGQNPQQNSLQTKSTSQQPSHEVAHRDPPNTASQETGSIFGGLLGGLSSYNEKPVKSLFSRLGGSSPQPSSIPQPTTGLTADTEIPEKVAPKQLQGIDVIDDAQKPQPAIHSIQEAVPLKEPPGKGLLSLFGVHSPQQNTPQATSIQSGFLSGSNGNKGTAKGLFSLFGKLSHEQNVQANLSPGESAMENEQTTKCSVKCIPLESSAPTPQQPDSASVLPDDELPIFNTPTRPTSIPLPDQTPDTGLLPTLSEVFQSTETPHVQTCTSLETASALVPKDIASNDTISIPVESTSNLPTPPICSGPEVTSQNAASGLFSMFSGSNSQNIAPQVGSVLGGIFPGTTGQKDIPGKSLFSMFSGSSSKSTLSAEGHGPSASKEPPGKSLFTMFGGTRPQEPSPPTSLLGGIFPGGITPKDISGRGLLSMFSGHSPTTPSQAETTSKPPEAEGHFNVSSSFSQGSTSKDDASVSEERNLELQKSQVMSSGLCGADDKTANTISGDGTKKIQGNEPMTLQPQSVSSKQQNSSHSITEAEKETREGKSTADSQDMKGPPAFSEELVSNTHSWPEQNEKQNLPLNKIQPLPKQEDMTTISDSGVDKGQQKSADVEKSVFDTSANVVSGLMSKMFSGVSGPSKTSSGLFSSAQTSFFKSTSTKGSESQQATSVFGLPSHLSTDSLKSDRLCMFKSHQTVKPAEANLNSTPLTESTEFAVQDQRVPNDIVSSSEDVKSTENLIKTESNVAQQSLHQVKSEDPIANLTPESVNPSEVTSITTLGNDEVIESDLVTGQPTVIVGEPEDALMDKSGPAQEPPISEPSQSMFDITGLSLPKLSFISESEDASKSFGSLFSSASKGLPTMSQTGGGGLLFGFKSFSTSVFSDEKPVASSNEPTSLFGAKIGLWQKEAPIPIKKQTPCGVTAQPNSPGYPKSTSETDLGLLVSKEVKENVNKPDNEIIHGIVTDLDSFEFEAQNKSIDSLDDSKLQISMSAFKIDNLSQKEQESLIQLPSSAAISSGLQQEYMELLSAKRLVAS